MVSAPAADNATTRIAPASGPKRGGTRVVVTSAALFPADTAVCNFGARPVPGNFSIVGSVQPGTAPQLLSLLRLTCVSPAADPAVADISVVLTSGAYTKTLVAPFTFYDEKMITALEETGSLGINPPWIDFSGSDNITIRGDGLFTLGDSPRLRIAAPGRALPSGRRDAPGAAEAPRAPTVPAGGGARRLLQGVLHRTCGTSTGPAADCMHAWYFHGVHVRVHA